MKKLLITGFEPFGGQNINPSWQSVLALENQIGDCQLTKLEIPTAFKRGADCVLKKAKEINPDVIICVGQAGGRNAVTLEVVAINLMDANIPDNLGYKPINTPILEDGENAYFSNLPIREMVEAINREGVPSKLSYSAGAFVCNEVLYTLLHEYNGTCVKVGFIHVPFLPEQTDGTMPSLEKEQIVRALASAIKVL
ncbi:MAG: pyroglutamyl-peptidase I [Clostridia bacterium]|nr:pyroglutamyl-peptidase I [Clostridia bacterium]